ncbi:FAD/NAD(P)-binding domain-containing protein [Pseudovirgaria hyperparasitica]|uniref:FAD/NAD(P)-binding domain-containing protein n=1 Tax=Pseudovirgaria hyperparasitica TaxID=470096 RepID=A0A6A6W597_9PEZI|nr:FAD/NAD(P)-binding domain-containing protein [Pseudovirgaria hyperparasitica]KAF2756231.1 FAD/NAD(P)-binding domain-containing protein [Pseudovirgaria hyperparasitica]
MSSPKVAIIGAGPAGLTLASILHKNSINVTLYDLDADRYSRNSGGSLDIHPDSGQRALKEAGLLDEFLKYARPEGETLRIIAPDGTTLMDESRGDEGRPADEFANRPEIDRRQLRSMLLDSLNDSVIQWKSKLLRVEDNPGQKLKLHFADRTEEGFDFVIGADGAWSKVRSLLSDVKPFYSGVGGLECHITDADAKHPMLAQHVGNGMCLNLGSDKGIMCQRNGDGGIQAYAFARLPETWYQTCGISFTDQTARKAVADALFADFSENLQSLILESDDDTVGRPLYQLPVDFTWSNNPRVTLVGDAAHLMTPFAGVGVNVAMQDSLELALEIISANKSGYFGSALENYELKMWKRARQNAEQTMMYLNLFFHHRGGIAMVEYFAERQKAMRLKEAHGKDMASVQTIEQKTIVD